MNANKILALAATTVMVLAACAAPPAPAQPAAPAAPAATEAPAAATEAPAAAATEAPATAATEAPATAATEPVSATNSTNAEGKFYWVQNTAWHPVHQLTQLAFMAGCKEAGVECELATTDEGSLEALVALAEQTVARPDARGVAMWAGGLPVVKPIIEQAKARGIPIVLPHFPVEEGFYADNAVQIAADPTKWPDPLAKTMCDQLQGQKGSVAITQNGHNATEDAVARVFAESMAKYCPDLKILPVELEGAEPIGAIAVATAIIQANPDIVAALSTTGGGPTTWAGAQKETGKKILAVGMDYTRQNLDLVKSGEVFGTVAQPLYEETFGVAELLKTMVSGGKVPYWTLLEAPLITNANIDQYYAILDKLEPQMRPTPTTKAP